MLQVLCETTVYLSILYSSTSVVTRSQNIEGDVMFKAVIKILKLKFGRNFEVEF